MMQQFLLELCQASALQLALPRGLASSFLDTTQAFPSYLISISDPETDDKGLE
jgi:hypothetical protein